MKESTGFQLRSSLIVPFHKLQRRKERNREGAKEGGRKLGREGGRKKKNKKKEERKKEKERDRESKGKANVFNCQLLECGRDNGISYI